METSSYITGFADGEGCFSVSFNLRSRLTTRIEVRPSFSISQKYFSLEVLKEIHAFFGCGSIRYCKNDGTYKYEVRSITDLQKRIIPHFIQYPLKTAKKHDFEKFMQICDLISRNLHLNKENLSKILDIAYQMNQSGKRKYSLAVLRKQLGYPNVSDKMKV